MVFFEIYLKIGCSPKSGLTLALADSGCAAAVEPFGSLAFYSRLKSSFISVGTVLAKILVHSLGFTIAV
jgi:hypothetical protein